MTIIEAQREVAKILKEGGVENAMNEARFLLQDALGYDSVQLVTGYRDYACTSCVETAFDWAKRRAAGEPMQYILGHTDFMGLEIRVAPGVLIPRPETEGLCEVLAEEAKARQFAAKSENAAQPDSSKVWPARILDLCTGSGCIAAWAASAFGDAQIVAADLSEAALAIAAENCRAHESHPGQIELLQGDLFGALNDGSGNRPQFDAILSNPPYIPSKTVDELEPEVKDHEPRLALDGGPEGMDLVSRIIKEAPDWLAPGGLLLMEIDDTQEELVRAACEECGRYASFAVLRDLAGKIRYLKARI
ncbi:MAG: peptide chain release factor N(5)-glutamine methyltransferase [Firmicutes bacterium]|nr:peptide chain release factor N(5)-glutamine methyltransferase [Bacillota bacterium]